MLSLAADQEHAPAMYFLGQMYTQGLGVERDYPAAFEWYKKSADLGFPPAILEVAVYYAEGVGVEKDCAAARSYLDAGLATGEPQFAEARPFVLEQAGCPLQ